MQNDKRSSSCVRILPRGVMWSLSDPENVAHFQFLHEVSGKNSPLRKDKDKNFLMGNQFMRGGGDGGQGWGYLCFLEERELKEILA